MLGKITDIETMGSADGPGVRLVLFLSGCKLRCLYCHNPETWLMKNFKRTISSAEVLNLYNKYKGYYGKHGGVTFSGGEPLLQSEFVLETCKLLKENNIHVALDTSGVAENYEEILDYVDLVILDVKAVEKFEYKKITGRDISEFNAFLEVCQKKNKPLWLRQVIVPGLNDDKEHVEKLKNFASKLKNVERVELLGYHSMAKKKYLEMGLKYRLEEVEDMDKTKLKQLQNLLENKKITR
ncbi:MAG: pyruvate formate lyase-activating protein [Clostridiales bacterium]|nr:pyruvate formate lyase-activating protein [Clostridiales bacterium]